MVLCPCVEKIFKLFCIVPDVIIWQHRTQLVDGFSHPNITELLTLCPDIELSESCLLYNSLRAKATDSSLCLND